MGKVGVLRKDEGNAGGVAVSPQGDVSYVLGGSGVQDPSSEKFQEMYGEVGSESHNRAVNAMRMGRYMRYGLAGLGAFNSMYNQMASGEPGLGGAIAQGAMGGWYGSGGLENAMLPRGGVRQEAGQEAGQEEGEPHSSSNSGRPMNQEDVINFLAQSFMSEGMSQEDAMNNAMQLLREQKEEGSSEEGSSDNSTFETRLRDLKERFGSRQQRSIGDIMENYGSGF